MYAAWALLDGDSLTDRIFEHGIADAEVFIVVLSQNSIGSNWVRAELDVGLVRRIGNKARLIPVVLDGVEPPVALEATLQRRIANTDSYDEEFEGLLRSIFAETSTPPLGTPPAYAGAPAHRGLTSIDSLVLRALSRIAVGQGHTLIQGEELHARCAELGIDGPGTVEAVHAIDDRHLMNQARIFNGRVSHVQIRLSLVHLQQQQDRNLAVVEKQLVAQIVNGQGPRHDLSTIADTVGVERLVAEAVLDRHEPRLLTISRRMGGAVYIDRVSSLLARLLD